MMYDLVVPIGVYGVAVDDNQQGPEVFAVV